MLRNRIITAAVLIPLVIGGLFYLPLQSFAGALGAVFLMATWEMSRLCGLKSYSKRVSYMILMAMLYATSLNMDPLLILGFAGIWWIVTLFMLIPFPKGTEVSFKQPYPALFSTLILVPAWYALIELRAMDNGPWLILYLLLVIWAADSGAYFAGRRFGKTKLAPKLSPGKSVEGVFGGLVLVVLVAIAGFEFTDIVHSDLSHWFAAAMLTFVASILGDLTESMFKRVEGIKDSGNILPGHGGIMDRIDSLTAAAPIFLLSLILLDINVA